MPPEASPVPEINLRRIIRNTIFGVVILMAGLGLVVYLFREPLEAFSKDFVDTLGGFGVALGFFVPDGFTVPLPNDAFTSFGRLAGLPYWEVVMWGTIGSLAGGCTGFGIGRLLSRTDWFEAFMARKGNEVRLLTDKYGSVALAVAALTPIPYSIACWASGAAGMTFVRFILISAPLRFIRVAVYLFLIEQGVLNVIAQS